MDHSRNTRVTALYKGREEEFDASNTNLATQLIKIARDQFGIGLKAVETDDGSEISLEDLDDWVFDARLRLRLIGDLDHCLHERRTENEITLSLRCKDEPCRVSDLGGHGAMFALPSQGREVTYRPTNGTWKLIRCERSPEGVVAVLVRNPCRVFVSSGNDFLEETVEYPDFHCHVSGKVNIHPIIQGSPSLFRATSKLPSGLVVDPVSGAISGTPTVPARGSVYSITWNENQCSSAIIDVLPSPKEIKSYRCDGIPRGIGGDSEFVYLCIGHCLKRIHIPSGITEVLAGTDTPGFDGDLRPASSARFDSVMGLCVHDGDVYICDSGNHRVRKYSIKNKVVTTIAGNGQNRSTGDGELAVNASLSKPYDCCMLCNKLYVSDSTGQCVRVVDLSTGLISTFCPDVELVQPQGLTIFNGEIVVSDFAASQLIILSRAQVLGSYAEMGSPVGILGTSRGIYACDMARHRLVFVNPTKGTEVLDVELNRPWGLSEHGQHLFVSDSGNERVLYW